MADDAPTAANTASLPADSASEATHSLSSPVAAREAATVAKQTSGRQALRSAAQAVLAAWDHPAEGHPDLPAAVDGLRATLAAVPSSHAPANPGKPRPPRQDIKHAIVLALLRRPEGLSGPEMAEATG